MRDGLMDNQSLWDQHAASDPLWAVLSYPDKRGGRWNLQEFMKTGEREIALLFHRFAELQLGTPDGQALDFGCGVGRLTQALARRHPRVVGADISPVMVDLARRLNAYPDRARYLCTAETGLDTLPAESFQAIYSSIVLQHVPPDLSVRYLHEFFRLLGRDGLLMVQLPSHRETLVEAEITAMPDAAYSAAIRLTSPLPTRVAASGELTVTLMVKNTSDHAWSQPLTGPLAVGNHWLDAAGALMLMQDDGRAPLLQVVPPGLEWPVTLRMRAPSTPGTCLCEIDLVHEGITWFGLKDSPTLRFSIEVMRNTDVGEAPPTTMMKEYAIPDYPETELPTPPSIRPESVDEGLPMHGVPRAQVMDIINEHGGRLAGLEDDRRAGPGWVSYRYFVVGRPA